MCGCFSRTPYWEPGPQPRHVPWLGIEPVTLWFTGQRSIHWATPARVRHFFEVYSLGMLLFDYLGFKCVGDSLTTQLSLLNPRLCFLFLLMALKLSSRPPGVGLANTGSSDHLCLGIHNFTSSPKSEEFL